MSKKYKYLDYFNEKGITLPSQQKEERSKKLEEFSKSQDEKLKSVQTSKKFISPVTTKVNDTSKLDKHTYNKKDTSITVRGVTKNNRNTMKNSIQSSMQDNLLPTKFDKAPVTLPTNFHAPKSTTVSLNNLKTGSLQDKMKLLNDISNVDNLKATPKAVETTTKASNNKTDTSKGKTDADTKKPSALDWLGANANAGRSSFSSGVMDSLDMTNTARSEAVKHFEQEKPNKLEDFLENALKKITNYQEPNKNTPNVYDKMYDKYASTVSNTAEEYRGWHADNVQKADEINKAKGGAWETGGQLVQGAVGALPSMITAKAGKGLSFATNLASSVGNMYTEAKNEGASELEAVATAVISSAISSGIEVSGGLEGMPRNTGAIKSLVKTLLDEGKEEVLQSIVQDTVKKFSYDEDKKVFSLDDSDAIINPKTLAQKGLSAAAIALILGGGQIATSKAISSVTGKNSTTDFNNDLSQFDNTETDVSKSTNLQDVSTNTNSDNKPYNNENLSLLSKRIENAQNEVLYLDEEFKRTQNSSLREDFAQDYETATNRVQQLQGQLERMQSENAYYGSMQAIQQQRQAKLTLQAEQANTIENTLTNFAEEHTPSIEDIATLEGMDYVSPTVNQLKNQLNEVERLKNEQNELYVQIQNADSAPLFLQKRNDLNQVKQQFNNGLQELKQLQSAVISDYSDNILPKLRSSSPLPNINIGNQVNNQFTGDLQQTTGRTTGLSDDVIANTSQMVTDSPYGEMQSQTNNNTPLEQNTVTDAYKPTRTQVKQDYRRQMDELTQDVEQWTDRKTGYGHAVNTQERNISAITSPETATKIKEQIFDQVHQNESLATKLKNTMRERVKALNLNDKESVMVQMLAEQNSEGFNSAAMDEFYQQYKSEIDLDKANNAVTEFRNIYNELITLANEVLTRNGYDPVPYRQDYFPHFTEETADGIFSKVAKTLGLDIQNTNLPTEIAGRTHIFKPGKKYMPNFLRRTTNETTYDAVAGFDRYIEGIADVIHHTDDIQRLRAFEDVIRYKLSDDGIKAKVDEIQARDDIDPMAKESMIDEIYNTDQTKLGNYVTNLRKYTDNLAGKKSIGDREWEHNVGRGMYDFMKKVEGKVAGNMVGGNIATAFTNFIPLAQSTGEIPEKYLVTAMLSTMRNVAKQDNLIDNSVFLTNRRGSDALVKTKGEKFSDVLSTPMQLVDNFVSESIVRARYTQNIQKGMDNRAALQEADSFAAGLMGDRSKGATPTVFNEKNPVTKLFTMFQLEVANQYGYMGDAVNRLNNEGKGKLIAGVSKFLLYQFLFNEVYEKITGRRPAFDPIGSALNVAGVDYDYGFKDGTPYFNAEIKEKKASEILSDAIGEALEQTPFVGGVLGGGRIPISSALPDGSELLKLADSDIDSKKKLDIAIKEFSKPLLYVVPPAGGGQLKKTIDGVSAVKNRGSYQTDNNGDPILMFPVHNQDAKNYAKAAVFGKYALEEGKEYVEDGFKRLSADDTKNYKKALTYGIDSELFIDALKKAKSTEKLVDGKGDIVKGENQLIREQIMEINGLIPTHKQFLDKAFTKTDTPAKYDNMGIFRASTELSKDTFDKAKDAFQKGVDYNNFVDVYQAIKSVKDSAEKRKIIKDFDLPAREKNILDELLINDGTYIPKEVQADYSSDQSFTLSQMSDAAQNKYQLFENAGIAYDDYQEVWNAIYKGSPKKAEAIQNLRNCGYSESESYTLYKLAKSKAK